MFSIHGKNSIDQLAAYATDEIKPGDFTADIGLRYARTMETPFNGNLLLSSATGTGGLAQNVFGA